MSIPENPVVVEKDPSDMSEVAGLTNDEEIVEEAKERYKMCLEYETSIRSEAEKDLAFLSGQQWDNEVRNQRELDSRPTLTINRLNPFVNQVKNDLIQNSPSIKICAVDTKDKKTANVINGLIRHIVSGVDGKSAFDTALSYAIRCGVGYIRIKTDYVSEWDQDIIIERIEDPLLVHFPLPLIKMQDYSDAPYCLVRTRISKRDYKELYPDKWDEYSKWETEGGETYADWGDKESLWLAEYFRVEKTKKTIYLLSTGETVDSKDNLPEGSTVIKDREIEDRKVWRYLLSGASVLEKTEIRCKYIPIVPVTGDEMVINGKKNYISLIRFVRDIQAMYNLLKSKELELIALSAKAQWMAPAGSIPPNLMNDWKVSNVKSIPVLFYDPTPNNNPNVSGRPEQIQNRQIDIATITASKECIDDIKAVTGIYDRSLGAAGNETSGKAIIAVQKQGDTANAHFYESFVRMLRHVGRILVDMIPSYYDTPRTIRVVGEDLTDEVISINQMYPDEEGKLYNFEDVGNYAVIVDTGPSYDTRRAETAQGIISILQSNPQIWATLGDILLQNLDWVGSDRAVRRLKAIMDPKVLAADQDVGGDIDQMQAVKVQLMQAQQQLQQAGMQQQQMQQLIQAMDAQIKSKQAEYDSKLELQRIKAEAEIAKANISLQQTQILNHGKLVTHAVDSSIQLHNAINPIGQQGTADQLQTIGAAAPAQDGGGQ